MAKNVFMVGMPLMPLPPGFTAVVKYLPDRIYITNLPDPLFEIYLRKLRDVIFFG